MLFQPALVGQDPIQAAIQARVVDLALSDLQQIIQRRRRIPAFLDRQLTARRTEPVDGQYRRYPRPGHLRRIVVHRLLKKTIQSQTPPQLQAQETATELPRSFQTDTLY